MVQSNRASTSRTERKSSTNTMLRKTRITLALIFWIGITLLFIDITGLAHTYLGWMAKVQFLPALLATNLIVVVALLLLTLIMGRIYCSVICPLGVMQDFIAWMSRRPLFRKNKRAKLANRYSYSKPKQWLRIAVLAVFVILLLAGFTSITALLAPYSAYGRIAANLIQPVYVWANNLLARMAEHYDSYAFYTTDLWLKSTLSLAIAAATLLVVGFLAWRNGRTWCNTICPVGTVLGFVARFSRVRIYIDKEKCTSCGLCTRNCKASCIDPETHDVDPTRCIVCGDCLQVCHAKAMKHGIPHTPERQPDGERRQFLSLLAMTSVAATLKAQEKTVDGGLAIIEDKQLPTRTTPLTPPGSQSQRNLQQHCTSCQLCVAQCPNGVLRPSDSLENFMQPEMQYERGYCRPECNRCSQVCPTGAIKPITVEQRTAIQVGHAKWIKKNCIPVTEGQQCGNCARHCPAQAIQMVPNPDDETAPLIPAIDTEKCIGCGACENLCPARPFSAIYVEGHEVHREI